MKILKIQIHVVQNVGKVWISRERNFLAPFQIMLGICCMDRNKSNNCKKDRMFPLAGQWALFTRFGVIAVVIER